MTEHHTQGRQGQGSRRRKNYNRHSRRPRVPREEVKAPKLTFFQRLLGFFGFGPKKDANKNAKNGRNQRSEQKNQQDRNPRNKKQAGGKGKTGVRERIPSTPPTRNSRLHVGNLSYEATESELEELFKGFGAVKNVTVIYNRRTYKSKGYAFVEMRYMEDACKAAEVLHGQPFMGRELMVSAADDKRIEEEKAAEAAENNAVEQEVVIKAAETPAEEKQEA
ncbi:MAG: RNA-binding protein [Akkermansia sp.]